MGEVDLFATLISHDRTRMYVAGGDGNVLVSTDNGAAWSSINQAGPTLFALEDVAPH